MNNCVYNYEEWLSTHSGSKTMMEKLERSLVPYELFMAMGLVNDRQEREGEVTLNENTYHYHVTYDYQCIGHDVYDAVVGATTINNRWQNLIMGMNRFKVVMDRQQIKTIYTDHENYFQQVIDMFEKDDTAGLYHNRSAYINNLLARYILLRMLEQHRPELKLLKTVNNPEDGKVFVMAASVDQKEMVMYAFGKREAMDMAQHFDGICQRLTIVYFLNRDFETDGNNRGFDTGCTRVVSARAFTQELIDDNIERRLIERRMLLLTSLLYNEHLEWHPNRIKRVVADPPLYHKFQREKKKELKGKRKKAAKKQLQEKQGLPWWEKIPRTLLEDALNVLGDTPVTHSDIFHFLCASNIVNAYVNQCKERGKLPPRLVQRMYQAKKQIFAGLLSLVQTKNRNVDISLSSLPALMVSITVEQQHFQISFRGMSQEAIAEFYASGVRTDGFFEGTYLQPIATALYQYSYLLRWKGLPTTLSSTESVASSKV